MAGSLLLKVFQSVAVNNPRVMVSAFGMVVVAIMPLMVLVKILVVSSQVKRLELIKEEVALTPLTVEVIMLSEEAN